MHEFAIARSLVDAAIDVARNAGVSRITRIRCRIGDLQQVDGDLLGDAFSAVCDGTVCEAADLCIERTHMAFDCERCGTTFLVGEWDWSCPGCGESGSHARGGDELELIGIDGELNDGNQSAPKCV